MSLGGVTSRELPCGKAVPEGQARRGTLCETGHHDAGGPSQCPQGLTSRKHLYVAETQE